PRTSPWRLSRWVEAGPRADRARERTMRGALREAEPGGATGPAATAPLLVADRPGPPQDGRRTGGHVRARVVIGIHDLPFHQEVQDFLGRHPEIEIAASATDAERLGTFLREV